MKTKILGNKAAAGLIVTLITLLIFSNLMQRVVIKAQANIDRRVVSQPTPQEKPYPVINHITFPEGIDRQEFNLNPNGWVQVITPPGSKFRIQSPPNTDIWFLNGQKIKDGPYEANWVGIKVGNDIFWMRAPEGKATVTIKR